MTKKYVYFVSYTHSNGNGNAITAINAKIDCPEALMATEKMLTENDNRIVSVCINNFILLREESE